MRFVTYGANLSLDTMQRVGETPNGLNEALVVRALELARERGVGEVSLNYAGLAHLVRREPSRNRARRALTGVLLAPLHRRFQMDRLVRFNDKFSPQWRPRYLVYESRTALPRSIVRVLQAEGYLSYHRRSDPSEALSGVLPRATARLRPRGPIERAAVKRLRHALSPRHPAVVAAALGLALIGVIGAYSYWQAYYQHRGFAPVAFLPHARPGRRVTVQFYSQALHREADYLVYLPPGYSNGERYPVYYLLHGSPGRPEVFWSIASMPVRMDNLISLHRMRPMILVFPDGRIGGSAYSDSEWANTPSGNYASYVIDVVDDVDHRFDTLADRDDRVIAGFSMGAYGATNILLHNLTVFGNLAVLVGLLRADAQRRVRPCQPRHAQRQQPAALRRAAALGDRRRPGARVHVRRPRRQRQPAAGADGASAGGGGGPGHVRPVPRRP